MPRSFVTFETKGIQQMLKDIKNYAKDVQEEVELELEASAREIERNAKRAAPVDMGFLRNSISSKKNQEFVYEIVVQRYYGPYVEFGTGGLVDVPAGLEQYAMQFKGDGIRQVNLPARPFLFPAYEAERVLLVKRLKAILGI
jgi:HK97 gp10 family phage protein